MPGPPTRRVRTGAVSVALVARRLPVDTLPSAEAMIRKLPQDGTMLCRGPGEQAAPEASDRYSAGIPNLLWPMGGNL